MTSSLAEESVIVCIDFAFLLTAHVIPAAAIKQSTPPIAAPVTILGLVLVLVESLIELELRYNELAWLDTVLVRAVPPSNHGQESLRMSVSGNIAEFELVDPSLLPASYSALSV
jgi:hypothetical protein